MFIHEYTQPTFEIRIYLYESSIYNYVSVISCTYLSYKKNYSVIFEVIIVAYSYLKNKQRL